MSKELILKKSIVINAPTSKIWDYLINPEHTREYMYGCDVISEWTIGSPVLWKGTYEGKEMIFVKGNLVSIIPEKLLEYTVFDPNSDIADIPENYLTVTCELKELNGTVELSISQGDYSKVANGEARYKDSESGWDILGKIKELIEK